MRLVFAGADYEENLGMCMIVAAAESAGHHAYVVPFQNGEGSVAAVQRILWQTTTASRARPRCSGCGSPPRIGYGTRHSTRSSAT
jgi:hypothetical protein